MKGRSQLRIAVPVICGETGNWLSWEQLCFLLMSGTLRACNCYIYRLKSDHLCESGPRRLSPENFGTRFIPLC